MIRSNSDCFCWRNANFKKGNGAFNQLAMGFADFCVMLATLGALLRATPSQSQAAEFGYFLSL